MKSPKELAEKIARQWQNPKLREQRLLNYGEWPLLLTIKKPSASDIMANLPRVRTHLDRWKKIEVGEVIWEEVQYRGISDPIEVPVTWKIKRPIEWVEATCNKKVKSEFKKLAKIMNSVDKIFHSLLTRQLHLITERPDDEIIKACELALLLKAGCAQGHPLRAMPYLGIDSKFCERNRQLIIKLLDIRFNGIVSELGLEQFLGAINESDHWILVADLAQNNLPFRQLRIRGSELAMTALSTGRILIIENESCFHHLPQVEDTIAILGAGLDLSWVKAQWLSEKKIGYWGDIDTWGLTMLARARRYQSSLTALLMSESLYDEYGRQNAVKEPRIAGESPPIGLSEQEKRLYLRLISEEMGRLEQEFIPEHIVKSEILKWVNGVTGQHAKGD